jgi:hypothetical protein
MYLLSVLTVVATLQASSVVPETWFNKNPKQTPIHLDGIIT